MLSVFSIKGAPGVTTLSSLLAAAWPASGPVMLVEADPAGGDLAARFGLSSRDGWVSLASSTRRSDDTPLLTDHLQLLPGGLPVLVGARGDDRRSADSYEGTVVHSSLEETPDDGGERVRSGTSSSGLSVIDLGRYAAGDVVSETWLRRSDASIVVVPGEASAAVHLRDRAPQLLDACGGRLGLVVVGGTYGCSDMAAFTGITGISDLPMDPSAAAMAGGMPGSGRRLEASLLWVAVGKLAGSLSHRLDSGWSIVEGPSPSPSPSPSEAEVVDSSASAPSPIPRQRRPGRRESFSRPFGRRRSRSEGATDGDDNTDAPLPTRDLVSVGEWELDFLEASEAVPPASA